VVQPSWWESFQDWEDGAVVQAEVVRDEVSPHDVVDVVDEVGHHGRVAAVRRCGWTSMPGYAAGGRG